MRAFSETFIRIVWKRFKEGYDTMAIAKGMDLDEATVYNALAQRELL